MLATLSQYVPLLTLTDHLEWSAAIKALCLQEKSGLDEQPGMSTASQQGGISVVDTVGSPAPVQAAEQAEVAHMADAAGAAHNSSEAQKAPASSAAASPVTQELPPTSRQLSEADQSNAEYTQFGSQLLSLSSESLSALPTPMHPAAVPPAEAQDLNNALARSLLQGNRTSGITDAEAQSARLTSAYSGRSLVYDDLYFTAAATQHSMCASMLLVSAKVVSACA